MNGEFFSDSSSLYFYSALVQANAAIIAVGGMYVISQIQLMTGQIDAITQHIFAVIQKDYAPRNTILPTILAFDALTFAEKEGQYEDFVKKVPGFDKEVRLRQNIERKIAKLKETTRRSAGLVAGGVLGNTIALMFAFYLNQCGTLVEGAVMAVAIIYQAVIVYSTYAIISDTMR